MIWNHLLHAGLGLIASGMFPWSFSGVLTSIAFSAIAQGIDMIRLYNFYRVRFSPNQEPTRSEIMVFIYKLSQLYILKIVWYATITFIAAYIIRSFK